MDHPAPDEQERAPGSALPVPVPTHTALIPLANDSATRDLIVHGTPAMDQDDPNQTIPPQILIIPGSGIPTPLYIPPSPRRLRTQLIISAVSCLLIATMLVAIVPLSTSLTGHTSPFSVLAQAISVQRPAYILYRVQPEDSFDSIAARFGVTVPGIYELNHLYAGSEAQVGEMLRISTDPTYGSSYKPPAPVIALPIMSGGNSAGNCVFCSQAGWTNGAGQPCASPGVQPTTAIDAYGLIEPENGAHWVRGFTAYHNGVDMSTYVAGSPILAVQTGVVIFAGWDPYGFGWAVKINHCGGLATSYGHMERLLVSVGQPVTQGQIIGLQGASGMASGIHLHFMTWWDNTPVDPLCAYANTSLAGEAGANHGACPSPQSPPAT